MIPLKPIEYAKMLNRLLDSMTVSEIAKKIEKSEEFVKKHLNLLK